MKKHLSKTLLAAFTVLFLSVSVLVGCGGALDSLAGTRWEVTKVNVNGVEMDGHQFYMQSYGVYGTMYLVFGGEMMSVCGMDGSGELDEFDAADYTYVNGRLFVDGQEIPVQFHGNSMVIEEGPGASMTLERR